ncbi:MAG: hypothetical protein WC374_02250 [Phycisphaerae bacterium]|jgi:carbonic anhydrase/acetyltransferase-like protein (isoleucine patch superfamily)
MKDNLHSNTCGNLPQVDSTAYVHPTAQIIGKINFGPKVFIRPNAVIRADEADDNGKVSPIAIGSECNVQDGL